MEKLVYSGPVPLEKIVVLQNPPAELYTWSISRIEVKDITKDTNISIFSDVEIFNETLRKEDGTVQSITISHDFDEYGLSAQTDNPNVYIKIWVEQTDF